MQWAAYTGHGRAPMRFGLLGGATQAARTVIADVVRIDPGGVGPAVLVVIGEALIDEAYHLVERAAAARVPHRLDADVLVVAGIVHLVELVAAAELGADRVPQ